MRMLLTISLLLLAATDLRAQGFSAGLRAGAGYWYTSDENFGYHLRTQEGSHLSFVPELFLRYNSKTRWAFEASCNRAELSHSATYPNWPEWEDTVRWTGNIKSTTWTLSAQYDLSCAAMRKCPLLRPLRSYLGVTIGLEQLSYTSDMYPDLRFTGAYEFTADAVRIWTGVNHTTTYELGKSWMLLSTAWFSVRPTALLEHRPILYYDHLVARFGGTVGVAYRF